MGLMAGSASQLMVFTNTQNWHYWHYRSATVNSKSFIRKDLLQIKWNYELAIHFKHEMIGKCFLLYLHNMMLVNEQLYINESKIITFEDYEIDCSC